MAKLTDEEVYKQIQELNEQMDHLADILSMMVDKMGRIEEATVQMKQEIQGDLDEIMDEIDIDYSNNKDGTS